MDLLQIKYFLLVAKYSSFSKAANVAFTSQSNVSKQVSQLEKDLDLKLFDRTTRHVLLTQQGQYFYEEMNPLLEKIDMVVEHLKSMEMKPVGTLLVGLHGQLAMDKIAPRLFYLFREQYPEVDLQIVSLGFKDLREGLLNEQLDIILTFSFEQQNNKSISHFIVSRSKPRIYFLEDLFETKTPAIQDFKDVSLISLDTDESKPAIAYMTEICETNHLEFKDHIRINTLETMKFYLESGLGVAILGCSYQITNNSKLNSVEIPKADALIGTDALWLKCNPNPVLPFFVGVLNQCRDN
jgi:DNA-binding transcriptional LysR family regulator